MTKQQYVVVETVATAGSISYWRIASTTILAALATAWKKHGLAEDQLPKSPKDEVALGRAVNAQAEKRRLVRPLARRGAWAIVEERAHTDAAVTAPLTYKTLVTVTMVQGVATVKAIEATEEERAAIAADIAVAYSDARNTLAHHDISAWLLDMAYAKLGAVSLRDSGGVYFIPRANVDAWNKIADAVEETGSTIFRIPAMRTAEAVAAITDAITAEAAAITQTMEDELQRTGEEALGKRALNTRVESAMALLGKLATYEELIGKQLDIRTRVELLSANVTAAALTATEAS